MSWRDYVDPPLASGVLLAPIGTLPPLPKLTRYPERIDVPIEDDINLLDDLVNPRDLVGVLVARVNAEHARMLRILPSPPPGQHWVAEVQRTEYGTRAPFVMTATTRIVYKLEDIDA